MKKSIIFYIHSITGLLSGVFILLMSLSGAVLIFHEELDSFQLPTIYPKQNSITTVDRCYQYILTKYPNAQISHCLIPEISHKPVSFFIYDLSFKKGQEKMELLLHPQSAQIIKTRGVRNDIQNNLMSWLSTFHSSFHLYKTGEFLLGFFSFVFLLSIITGIIHFRKKILSVLLFNKAVYKKNNLHQLIGVYALLFNMMIALTGLWMQRYVFKKEFYAIDNYTQTLKASTSLSFNFNKAYSNIQKKYPEFTAHVIYFAQSSKNKTALYGSFAGNAYVHSKNMADVIYLDSAGGVAKTRFINDIDVADRYDIINSQLHMGRFGGLGIKIIYFIFGLSGGLLSIIGFLMWRRRNNISKVFKHSSHKV